MSKLNQIQRELLSIDSAKFQKLGFQLSYPFFTMVYLIFCVSYPVIKHSSKILYEEAYLLELLVVWIFASLLVAKGIWQKEFADRMLTLIKTHPQATRLNAHYEKLKNPAYKKLSIFNTSFPLNEKETFETPPET